LEAAITYLDSVGKEEFLCVNSVFLCVSVVKLLEKHITTDTEVAQRTTEMEFSDIAIRFS